MRKGYNKKKVIFMKDAQSRTKNGLKKYMKKRNIVAVMLMLSMLAVFSITVSASGDNEFPILEKQVEIRQAHLKWTAEIMEISMDATIEYVDEVSFGAGTSELSELFDDFKDQTKKTEALTTHVAFNNALRQLRQIITDFRLETREQMTEHNGVGWQLLADIKEALDENKGKIDGLEDEYWEIREDNSLEIFDIWVDWAQNILDKIEDNGYDTIEAQAKLDEIKDERGSLENALKDRDNAEILQIHLELLDLSKELRDIVRDLQVEIPPKKIIEHWINVGDRIVDRTDTIISELDALGIDVTELREIHIKMGADLETAQEEFEALNFKEAIEALEEFKTHLIELRDAYEELIFGDTLPEEMEAKLEATIDVLDDSIKNMDNSI